MEGDKIKWFPASSLREGSVMLRPNFGVASPNVGVVVEKPRVNYYPNPSTGSFYVEGNAKDMEVFSMSGQKISFTAQEEPGRALITLTDASTGLYFLKMKKGNTVVTEKIVVRR